MAGTKRDSIIPEARIQRAILIIRGQKVILDAELAELYGTTTKALNQAIKRNSSRFPDDFMFSLSAEEKAEVVTICDHLQNLKYSPSLPNAFTEHGAIMAANVINSDRAVEMSVHIVRTFIHLREASLQYEELHRRLQQAERRLGQHDVHLAGIVKKIRELTEAPKAVKVRRIGFVVPEEEK
ncbi:ORF6N domain-containing protein [soil metagenome]